MKEKPLKEADCRVELSDADDDTDLCCCYVINSDGNYDDPCYEPVEDCCC